MKRIWALLRRDLLSTGKDYLLLYVTLAPLLVALGLRLFLPALGQAGVNVVVTPELPPTLVAAMEPYLHVEVVRDRAALEKRVLAYDDTVGIVPARPEGHTVVLEGNESHDSRVLPGMVLAHLSRGGGADGGPVAGIAQVEVTAARVPLRELMGAYLALGALFLTGTMMGFHIIEDKESRMLAALWVTPLSPRTYVAARSLLVVALSAVLVQAAVRLMGLTEFNSLHLLLVTLAGGLTAVLLGFLIGALSNNQISGIANLKFVSILVLLLPGLSLVLPERYMPVLYWLPPYWVFAAYRAVLEQQAGWAAVWPPALWSLVTAVLFLVGAFGWLRSKIAFPQN